jgi:hypothetical protein
MNNGSAFAGYTGFVQPNAPGNAGAYGITFANIAGSPREARRRHLAVALLAPMEGVSCMAVKRLLIAYDGSAPAQRALAHGAALARPDDAVSVINVMPEPGVGARIEPPAEARNRQWSLLGEAQRFLAGRGIDAATVSPVGDVATEILTAAERIGGPT